MTHPLTNDRLYDEFNGYDPADMRDFLAGSSSIFEAADMRKAADWQLEQVMTWLDENFNNYTPDGYFQPLYELIPDLKEAMRPTQEDN